MTINNQNILPKGHILDNGNYTYVIDEVLGCGGFGITYLALATVKVGNVTVKGKFAIKEHFVSSDCERDPDTSRVVYSNPAKERVESSRKDFIAEAKRLHKVGIEHPNIVKVNEVFEANNTAYYVMEYLSGQSLRSFVKQKKGLEESQMWSIMNTIIDAVLYLHKNMMTHLDIKPDNIMLTEDERGNLRPVLIDFGLSKHYDKNGKPTSTINTLGCSDGYAPVEQYAGITTFSPSADIYALGATMWFCLTGHDPNKSTETNEYSLIDSLSSSVSDITKQMIYKACASNRHDRNLKFQKNNETNPATVNPNILNVDTFCSTVELGPRCNIKNYQFCQVNKYVGYGIYLLATIIFLLPLFGFDVPCYWWSGFRLHNVFHLIGVITSIFIANYGFSNTAKFVESKFLKFILAGSIIMSLYEMDVHYFDIRRCIVWFVVYVIIVSIYEVVTKYLPKYTQLLMGFIIFWGLESLYYQDVYILYNKAYFIITYLF